MRFRLFSYRYNLLGYLAVIAAFIMLAGRQHFFVDQNAVNILYWDQWDFYFPLFHDAGLWDIFNYQHGPHRQGIGFVLTSFLAKLSGWNSRWDAFGVSFVLMGGAGLALQLARRCGAAGLGMLVVPLLFFNIRQYEIFVGPANISHGAMPIFLFMGLCLAWFIRHPGLRLGTLCVLTFLLIFTGFGLFVGLLVPPVLVVQAAQHFRDKENRKAGFVLLALVVIGAAWLLFAQGYRFDPAVEGFRFPYEKPLEYLYFVASMLNNLHGIRGGDDFTLGIGICMVVILAMLVGWHGSLLLRNSVEEESRSAVIFCLAAYALLYCFETAIGRVVLGWQEASLAPRYLTLMIPAGMAFYLHLVGMKNRWLSQALCVLYALFLVHGSGQLSAGEMQTVQYIRDGRLAWKVAYLQTRDEIQASERAGFLIYPAPLLHERLQFLEEHRLNLFNVQGLP